MQNTVFLPIEFEDCCFEIVMIESGHESESGHGCLGNQNNSGNKYFSKTDSGKGWLFKAGSLVLL